MALVLKPKGIEGIFPWDKEAIEEAMSVDAENELKAPQDGGSASKDPRREIEIRDSPLFPSVSNSLIRDSQVVETCHGEGAHKEEDFFRDLFSGVEDVTGSGDLKILRKRLSEVSSSSIPTDQFLARSVYPERKQNIMITVLEDARVLGALIGVANYLRGLVT